MKKFIYNVAHEAGQFLMRNIDTDYQISIKGGVAEQDLVTEIDKQCEDLIVKSLIKEFPEHGIIAEENTKLNTHAPYQWIIDPLDGRVFP